MTTGFEGRFPLVNFSLDPLPVNVIVRRPVMACTFHPSLCDDTGVTPQQTSFVTAGKPLKFDPVTE